MKYDPIKRSLGSFFNKTPLLRKLFYHLLNLLLLRSWHIRRELREIKRNSTAAPFILDAGSGFGQYAFTLSRMFRSSTVHGVDIKHEQIDDCNRFFKKIGKSSRVRFNYADLTQFSAVEKYDLALSVDVMEHIEDDVAVFKNIYKSLKSGGVLLISTPSDQGGSDVHDEDEESFIDEHVRDGYAVTEIEKKLQMSGFSSIETKFSYGNPGKISWRLSMKIPITLVNKSRVYLLLLPIYFLITFPFCIFLNLADSRMVHKSGTGLIVKCRK